MSVLGKEPIAADPIVSLRETPVTVTIHSSAIEPLVCLLNGECVTFALVLFWFITNFYIVVLLLSSRLLLLMKLELLFPRR